MIKYETSNLIKTIRIPRKPDNFSPSQTLSFAMYFAVSWLEPRLNINTTASAWTEEKTGPRDVSCKYPGHLISPSRLRSLSEYLLSLCSKLTSLLKI